VFGQSAGAISIAAHLFNTSLDLFRGAILHSGAPSTLASGATPSMWEPRSDQLFSFAGCHAPNTSLLTQGQSTFDCLKAAPADTLVAANLDMREEQYNSQA
jgi:carboxylesterase type B